MEKLNFIEMTDYVLAGKMFVITFLLFKLIYNKIIKKYGDETWIKISNNIFQGKSLYVTRNLLGIGIISYIIFLIIILNLDSFVIIILYLFTILLCEFRLN